MLILCLFAVVQVASSSHMGAPKVLMSSHVPGDEPMMQQYEEDMEMAEVEQPYNSYVMGSADKKAVLDKHNYYRSEVHPSASNMEYMRWHDELARLAQKWAERCDFSHGQPSGSKPFNGRIGQNLWASTARSPFIVATNSWVESEEPHYNYYTNKCKPGKICGHYTQVVWAKSAYVGCGTAYCKKLRNAFGRDGYIQVCNYGPAGNYRGQKPYKSGRPCSECPSGTSCKNNMCA